MTANVVVMPELTLNGKDPSTVFPRRLLGFSPREKGLFKTFPVKSIY